MYSQWGTYGLFVELHSILRWVVLAAGLLAAARAWIGRVGGRPWSSADTGVARAWVVSLDLQALVGILLYGVFNPAIAEAFRNTALAVQSRAMRFWVIEHPVAMLAALALAHIGLSKARKADGPESQRIASLFFTLALLLVLAAIPWPVFTYGRALWPLK